MKKFLKNIAQSFNRNQGQGLVEYGLLMILVIFAMSYVFYSEDATEKSVRGTILGNSSASVNPKVIKTPAVPKGTDAWNPNLGYAGGEGIQQKPVAFFTVPNTIYMGETVTYLDSSFDPDGEIVKRDWKGKQNVFNSAGDYEISLTVTDNDGLTDTFTVVVKVRVRENYTRIIHDMPNETRQLISEGEVYNVGNRDTFILDHKYHKVKDRYNVEHLVISQNYWETVQDKARIDRYEVKIPLIEVTYDSTGREISRKPYVKNGVVQYNIQTENRVVPQPAERKLEWKDNTWTFYIYESISSVRNEGESWGANSPSVDYSRFYPEAERTRQDPAFISSRNSLKSNTYASGATATTASTKCPTCTVPNRVSQKNVRQTQGNNVSCSYGSAYKTTHDRTYNWNEHVAVDKVYEYKGTNTITTTNGSMSEKQRYSWKTEGWQASEQIGNGGLATRDKYTDCSGSGENCWNPLTNNSTFSYGSWEVYDTSVQNDTPQTRTVPDGVDKDGKPKTKVEKRTRSRIIYYERRANYTCNWNGTSLTSEPFSHYSTNSYYGSWTEWSAWS